MSNKRSAEETACETARRKRMYRKPPTVNHTINKAQEIFRKYTCIRRIPKKVPDEKNMWMLIPLEIKFKIFEIIEADDLEKLAVTSVDTSRDIYKYLQTSTGQRHLSNNLLADASLSFNLKAPWRRIRNARTLGLLIRAATHAISRIEKIVFIYDTVLQLGWTWDLQDEDLYCNDSYFMCFGEFISAATSNWKKQDLIFAFPYFQKLTGMDAVIKAVLSTGPGRHPYNERALRLYFKYVYFMSSEKAMLLFWLGLFLKKLPYDQQARLLYIFFGPTRSGEYVSWSSVLGNNSLTCYYEISQLADFIVMISQHEDFPIGRAFDLVEALIVFPQPWHCFHSIHLLVCCGPKFLAQQMSKIFSLKGYNELVTFVIKCVWHLYTESKEFKVMIEAVEILFEKDLCDFQQYRENLSTLLNPSTMLTIDERELWTGTLHIPQEEEDIIRHSHPDSYVCTCDPLLLNFLE